MQSEAPLQSPSATRCSGPGFLAKLFPLIKFLLIKRGGLPALLLLALFSYTPTTVRAQGFGFYEHSACTMARAGAAVAAPCDDGSAIFFNPAGLPGEPGFTVSGGATLVITTGEFTADRTQEKTNLDTAPLPVPHFFFRYGINSRWAAGVGLYVPYGLGTEWPLDFEGRFVGYDNSLQSIYIQPTAAYQITDRISLGAGLTVVIGSVDLNQRLDLSQQPVPGQTFPDGSPVTFGNLGIPFHTGFADAKLHAGGATGIGGNFGVQVQATEWLHLGARFMLPVTLEYNGDAEFAQIKTGLILPPQNPIALGSDQIPNDQPLPLDDFLAAQGTFSSGPLVNQDVETKITMPAQFAAGVSLQATERLKILADYQWTNWSSFDVIPLDFENDALDGKRIEGYEDTHALRLGAEYQLNEAWQVRGGFLTHGAAAPDETVTPLLPEAYRNELTIGLGWRPADLFEINVAYQYISQSDRRGRVREAPFGQDEPTVDLNSGLYSFGGHLIGTTLTLHF